jgi:diacylglycerol kinase (ATP)
MSPTATGREVTGDVWLIANPLAGSGRGARHASMATAALTSAGIGSRLLLPTSAEDSARLARDAVAAGAAAVVACGGDGTVHAVLQSLVGTGVPLGIVAGGSGDDIAAGLGYATSDGGAIARELVQAIASGDSRTVDVGAATTDDGTQRFFLGVLSTGFDSSVNERANRMTRMGGQRYNVAMIRELASFRALPYDVTIDGERMTAPGMLVSVGNGPRFGGGMLICPDARPDDGLLDVTWLGSISKPAFLGVFPSVYRGAHVRHPAVRTFTGRSFHISAPGQVAYADGERIGPLPVSIEVRPRALRVLVTAAAVA